MNSPTRINHGALISLAKVVPGASLVVAVDGKPFSRITTVKDTVQSALVTMSETINSDVPYSASTVTCGMVGDKLQVLSRMGWIVECSAKYDGRGISVVKI